MSFVSFIFIDFDTKNRPFGLQIYVPFYMLVTQFEFLTKFNLALDFSFVIGRCHAER